MNTDIFSVLRGQQITSGRPFPGLTNAAPLPAKLEMIWCAWGNNCRRHFGPQTSHMCINVVRWIQWMKNDIFRVLRGQKLTSGWPFPGLTNGAPLPASEIRLDIGCNSTLWMTSGSTWMVWKHPGDLRQCREQFWYLEAATSVLSLE